MKTAAPSFSSCPARLLYSIFNNHHGTYTHVCVYIHQNYLSLSIHSKTGSDPKTLALNFYGPTGTPLRKERAEQEEGVRRTIPTPTSTVAAADSTPLARRQQAAAAESQPRLA